jgi:hypothetical protein
LLVVFILVALGLVCTNISNEGDRFRLRLGNGVRHGNSEKLWSQLWTNIKSEGDLFRVGLSSSEELWSTMKENTIMIFGD